MLKFKSVSIRNIMSYGEVEQVIPIENIGPCLVCASNGSGKSATFQAILWALFGRTMHKANPGDKILNNKTKGDGYVRLDFNDHDYLVRERSRAGHAKVTLVIDGHDVSVGTTVMQQRELNKLLSLDWDLFCGSTFFSEYGKQWMEMSDAKRREALEREFRIDRLTIYAQVAKENLQKVEVNQSKIRSLMAADKIVSDNLKAELIRVQKSIAEFEINKSKRVDDANHILQQLQNELDLAVAACPDVDKLKLKWQAFDKINIILVNKRDASLNLQSNISKISGLIAHNKTIISSWDNKGDFCSACLQSITPDHKHVQTEHPSEVVTNLTTELDKLNNELHVARDEIKSLETKIAELKPKVSVEQASLAIKAIERKRLVIDDQLSAIDRIKSEVDNNVASIGDINAKINDCEVKTQSNLNTLKKFDTIYSHFNYIYQAYNDRRKIKQYLLKQYVPYLNERLSYYLDKFELKHKFEFTTALIIQSESHDYTFYSSGERRRANIAMMLAMNDLHTTIYGRFCNLMVFDEVDNSLDLRGFEVFMDLIRNELTPSGCATFVISHRPDIVGTFPTEIKISKADGFSVISEIIR